MITGYQGNFDYNRPVVIANGQTASGVITTGGFSFCGFKTPAALTGTTITLQMCDTIDGTYVPVYNAAGAVSFTVTTSRFYAVDPKDFQGIQFLKLVSGSAESGARTIICALKGL